VAWMHPLPLATFDPEVWWQRNSPFGSHWPVVRPLSWFCRDRARAYRVVEFARGARTASCTAPSMSRPAEYDQCCRWNARNGAAWHQLREAPLLGVSYPGGIA